MREVDEQSSSRLSKRGSIIALGTAGVAALLIVASVIVVPMLGGGGESASPRGTPSAPLATPSSTQSPPATVAVVSGKLEPLEGRVLFGVQSVGSDIARGIPNAFSAAHVAKPTVTTWRKANAGKNRKKPLIATATIGSNGNALSKLRAFARLTNDAPRGSVDVALMAFDYQDVTAETDIDTLFDDYTQTMASIEAANPDITFLYTTTPVTTANSWRAVDQKTVTGLRDVDQPVWQDNIARERLNALIRDQYAPSGRLFDIAALQARIGGGKVAAKTHQDQAYFVMNPGLSADRNRLNREGSKQLATSLMLLVEAAAKP